MLIGTKSVIKIGAELILAGIIIPWVVFVTVAIFNSQKVDAVQASQFQSIIEKIDDLKESLNENGFIKKQGSKK